MQTELFKSPEPKASQPQIQSKPATKLFVPPHLNVLSNPDARQNAVYVLRIQLGSSLKKLGNNATAVDKHTFISLLATELKIKKGLTDAAIAGRHGVMINGSFK